MVVIERYSKMKKAIVVPNKGSTGSYAARMVVDMINEVGDRDRDIITKADQEPAIRFLVDDVCANRTGARTIREEAPKASKGRTAWLNGQSNRWSNASGPARRH